MSLRRAATMAAFVLMAAGVALALVPFGRPGSVREFTTADGATRLSSWCSPPIVSAWRHERVGGWFTYQSVAEVPPKFIWPACRPTARHRLALAIVLTLVGALGFLLLRRFQSPSRGDAPATR